MRHPAVHVAAIRKTYGRTVAVDDVSFEVEPGEIFGLIGPKGAGKTTAMECVEGLRLCDRVAIIDHGRIIDIGTPAELVRRHCPERTVVVGTDDPAAAERFRSVRQIQSLDREGSQVTLRGRGEDMVTEVIHCLAEHRMKVVDFRTEIPTLEDVYLEALAGHSAAPLYHPDGACAGQAAVHPRPRWR